MALQAYGSDSFQNTKTSNWNPSSSGQNWTQKNGAATPSIITDSGRKRGKLTGDTAANVWYIGTQQFADTDQYLRINVSNIACKTGLIARSTAGNTYYRADFVGTTLNIVLNQGGTVSTLATTTVAPVASTYYWLHFRTQGFGSAGSNPNNLLVNWWADPASGAGATPTGEPGGWLLTASDSTLTASGNFGLFYNAAGNAQFAYFDAYTATDCPAPGTTPAYNTVGDSPYGDTLYVPPGNPAPMVPQQILDLVGPNSATTTAFGNGVWMRYQWHWGQTGEPYQGVYDWGLLDDAVQRCNYAGIRIMVPLAYPPGFRQTVDGLGSNTTLTAARNAGTPYTTLPVAALPSGAYLPHLYQLSVDYRRNQPGNGLHLEPGLNLHERRNQHRYLHLQERTGGMDARAHARDRRTNL